MPLAFGLRACSTGLTFTPKGECRRAPYHWMRQAIFTALRIRGEPGRQVVAPRSGLRQTTPAVGRLPSFIHLTTAHLLVMGATRAVTLSWTHREIFTGRRNRAEPLSM